jgi:hypothetical protein
MPDEVTQETPAKEEAFFKEEEKPAETPEEETPEQLKEKLERLTKERDNLVEKVIKQSSARAEYKRELKATKAQLKELTEQFGDLPSKTEEKPEEKQAEGPEASAPAATPDLDKLVEEKLYEKEIVKAIRSKTQFREDAEVVKAYVDKMRKGGLSTGDAEQDVVDAMALLQKRSAGSSDMPSPSSVSTGGYAPTNPNRISKSTLEMGRMLGHTEEDFKKYGDGEIKII